MSAHLTGDAAAAAIQTARAKCIYAQMNRPRPVQGLPGRIWAAMPLSTRSVLVMLTIEGKDPRTIAMQPWEGLTDSQRAAIAATARVLRSDLSGAQSLF